MGGRVTIDGSWLVDLFSHLLVTSLSLLHSGMSLRNDVFGDLVKCTVLHTHPSQLPKHNSFRFKRFKSL